jgi:hypothetical protein
MHRSRGISEWCIAPRWRSLAPGVMHPTAFRCRVGTAHHPPISLDRPNPSLNLDYTPYPSPLTPSPPKAGNADRTTWATPTSRYSTEQHP